MRKEREWNNREGMRRNLELKKDNLEKRKSCKRGGRLRMRKEGGKLSAVKALFVSTR